MKNSIILIICFCSTYCIAQLDTIQAETGDFSIYEKCTPCYLILTESDGNRIEGLRHSDCAYGVLRRYYIDGTLKEIDPYMEYHGTDWSKAPCSVRNGERIFFNEHGVEIKKEVWKNGVLIE